MDDQAAGTTAARERPAGTAGRAGQHQRFEVVVSGAVSPALLAQLADVEVHPEKMSTVLSGRFRDQTALYCLLTRLRAFALDIVEIRRAAEPRGRADHE
jgi:hypothetical protein